MLSFFSKKKQSPETTPGDITIQGPAEGNVEGFVVVDNQHPGTHQSSTFPKANQMMPLYPYPPTSFGVEVNQGNCNSNTNQTPVPYIMGIPFKLSSQLCSKTSFEVTQMEVDGILALMTKQMQLENEYDFKLERGILNECY